MGIYLDTVEDNNEKEEWKITAIRQRLGIVSSLPKNSSSVKCPVCNRFLFTEKELNEHIFKEHRHDYKISNELIDSKDSYFDFSEVEQSQLFDLEKKIISLQLRIDRNDRSVDKEWFMYKTNYQSNLNNPRLKQYLFGFLEYLRAHDLEVNRHSTDFAALSRHFSDAYGKLQPFPSHLAQQARRAIALKMNWFWEYKKIPESSLFFLTWHFFTHTYEDIEKINDLPIFNERQQTGIIIDGFHSELLEAIKFYYSDRSVLNYNWLHKLEQLLKGIDNQNYADKLTLFKARLYRDWYEFSLAKEAYRSIRTHPDFGAEAKAFNS
ncbi:hypothetical protein [Pleurocapsa sp. PCC 7319]|uniref:hypothetical protein n=1 Tax=Pleurocapsa sp. PCC 7319 TaxID=118161 RepID=UPI00037762D2|nr:hypothetical protein [Pleurocapsa sp. PCC 7319]